MHPLARSAVSVVVLVTGALAATSATLDEAAFRQPPAEARPKTWMHVMDGNLARAGLECDNLSRAALDKHFAAYVGKLAEEAGALAGQSFRYSEIDSYEEGGVNWTEGFVENFRAAKGCDLIPFLPFVTGRLIADPATTDAVLGDYREHSLRLQRRLLRCGGRAPAPAGAGRSLGAAGGNSIRVPRPAGRETHEPQEAHPRRPVRLHPLLRPVPAGLLADPTLLSFPITTA